MGGCVVWYFFFLKSRVRLPSEILSLRSPILVGNRLQCNKKNRSSVSWTCSDPSRKTKCTVISIHSSRSQQPSNPSSLLQINIKKSFQNNNNNKKRGQDRPSIYSPLPTNLDRTAAAHRLKGHRTTTIPLPRQYALASGSPTFSYDVDILASNCEMARLRAALQLARPFLRIRKPNAA